jgi:hypothetical protein
MSRPLQPPAFPDFKNPPPAAARPASAAASNLSFAQRLAHGALSIGARWAWQRFGAFMTDAAWSSRPDVVLPLPLPQPQPQPQQPSAASAAEGEAAGGDVVIVDESGGSGSGIIPRRVMDWRRRVYVLTRRLEMLYRAASIANFLAFLYNGRCAPRTIYINHHVSIDRHHRITLGTLSVIVLCRCWPFLCDAATEALSTDCWACGCTILIRK